MSEVYSIINEHNGNIFIKESELNKGTTLEITLPSISNDKKREKAKLNIKNLTQKGLKILWVDDEEMIALLGKKYMTVLGHTGNIATSGKAAIKLLEQNKYDILITDIGMPKMNGWQLINHLRNEIKNKEIKIILVSGWNIDNDDLIKKYNISNILQKPITLKHLKEVLS